MPEERREQVTRVVIEQSQRLTGGTRRSRWKAAAFNGWHEPDKSRGLCPESVSGSGCKPPGRLGHGGTAHVHKRQRSVDGAIGANKTQCRVYPITVENERRHACDRRALRKRGNAYKKGTQGNKEHRARVRQPFKKQGIPP